MLPRRSPAPFGDLQYSVEFICYTDYVDIYLARMYTIRSWRAGRASDAAARFQPSLGKQHWSGRDYALLWTAAAEAGAAEAGAATEDEAAAEDGAEAEAASLVAPCRSPPPEPAVAAVSRSINRACLARISRSCTSCSTQRCGRGWSNARKQLQGVKKVEKSIFSQISLETWSKNNNNHIGSEQCVLCVR